MEKLRNALNSRTNHAIYYIKQGIFELDTVANNSTYFLPKLFQLGTEALSLHFPRGGELQGVWLTL